MLAERQESKAEVDRRITLDAEMIKLSVARAIMGTSSHGRFWPRQRSA